MTNSMVYITAQQENELKEASDSLHALRPSSEGRDMLCCRRSGIDDIAMHDVSQIGCLRYLFSSYFF